MQEPTRNPAVSLTRSVLRYPLRSVRDPSGARAFGEVVRLKAMAYGREYPPHVIPFDKLDFVGTHHLFWLRDELVGCYLENSVKTLRYHGIEMPLIEQARAAGARLHEQAIADWVEMAMRKAGDVLYQSSFAIAPHHRGNQEIGSRVREMIAASGADSMDEQGTEYSAISAVTRFKTHLTFERIGYRPLTDTSGSTVLPEIPYVARGGDGLLFMVMDRLSPWARDCQRQQKQEAGLAA